MKTRTRISKTTTTTRNIRAERLARALNYPETAAALWKQLGENPTLQPMRADRKLGRRAADLVFLAKDRSHALLIDCKVRESGLSEEQAFLHLHQLAYYLKECEYPLKTVSIAFLLPPGSPLAQKLLAAFNESYKLPTASLRKSSLSSVTFQGRGAKMAKNTFRYLLSLIYKDTKFDLSVTVKIIEAELAAALMAEPELASPAPSAPASQVPPPAETSSRNPGSRLRRYKDLLDEAVSTRSIAAWKQLGESPTLQRTRSLSGSDGPEIIYLSRDRSHCLLIDLHLEEEGPDPSQSTLHLETLTHLLGVRAYPIRSASLVFLVPPVSRHLLSEPFTAQFPPPDALAARLKTLGARLKGPGKSSPKNTLRFIAAVEAGGKTAELPLTVKFVEGPAALYEEPNAASRPGDSEKASSEAKDQGKFR